MNEKDTEPVEFAQIDAFTDKAFSGNPAAVVYLPGARNDEWYEKVAREFNLAETAFVIKRTGKGGKEEDACELSAGGKSDEYDLRWFTPTSEERLCGHATLAAAHFLAVHGLMGGGTAYFHTLSGLLTARQLSTAASPPDSDANAASETEGGQQRKRALTVGKYELDFPLEEATEVPLEDRDRYLSAVGEVGAKWVGKSTLRDIVVELPSEAAVREYRPDFAKLSTLTELRGIILTAQGSEDVDFVSRFFAPFDGVTEDPVTGSAHCTLGPYWGAKLGKNQLRGYQASQRGGIVDARVDLNRRRVYLQGSAIFVMVGNILSN